MSVDGSLDGQDWPWTVAEKGQSRAKFRAFSVSPEVKMAVFPTCFLSWQDCLWTMAGRVWNLGEVSRRLSGSADSSVSYWIPELAGLTVACSCGRAGAASRALSHSLGWQTGVSPAGTLGPWGCWHTVTVRGLEP